MEIIFKNEENNLIGSTKLLGIGKRKPELIYGKQAKKLREEANVTIENLAAEFDVRPNVIKKIESQQASLDEKMCTKYTNKFNVTKEYFFDLDLETLIITAEGHIIKSYDNSKDCKEAFDNIVKQYNEAVNEGKTYIIVDFGA